MSKHMTFMAFVERIKKAYQFTKGIDQIVADYRTQVVKVYRTGKNLPRVYRYSCINVTGGLRQKYRAWAMQEFMLVVYGDSATRMIEYAGVETHDNVFTGADFQKLTDEQIRNPR